MILRNAPANPRIRDRQSPVFVVHGEAWDDTQCTWRSRWMCHFLTSRLSFSCVEKNRKRIVQIKSREHVRGPLCLERKSRATFTQMRPAHLLCVYECDLRNVYLSKQMKKEKNRKSCSLDLWNKCIIMLQCSRVRIVNIPWEVKNADDFDRTNNRGLDRRIRLRCDVHGSKECHSLRVANICAVCFVVMTWHFCEILHFAACMPTLFDYVTCWAVNMITPVLEYIVSHLVFIFVRKMKRRRTLHSAHCPVARSVRLFECVSCTSKPMCCRCCE